MKIRFKTKTAVEPPEGYTGRAKKGHYCAISGEWVAISKSDVDHKIGGIPLKSEYDIIPFIIHMLADSDELQVLTKEMHKIKSYADRMGIDIELARATKEAIKLAKDKKDSDWIKARGYVPEKTIVKRRQQIIEILTKERNAIQ